MIQVTLQLAWLVGLSVSETADLLGFDHNTMSMVYRER